MKSSLLILSIVFLFSSFLLAQYNAGNKPVATVNGEVVLQKELDDLLQKSYGEEADGLKDVVIQAHLAEMLLFKIIDQKLRTITHIRPKPEDYEEDAERYSQPFFAYYAESGIKNTMKFIPELRIIISKNANLQKKYGDWLKDRENHLLAPTDRKTLVEIWQDAINTKELKPMLRERVCNRYHLAYSIYKERIKLITKLRLWVSQNFKDEEIRQFAQREKFALEDGLVRISHLFISTTNMETMQPFSPEMQKKAEQKILKIRDEITTDLNNFGEKTAQYSEHPTTRYNKGELGWIPRWSTGTLFSGFLGHLGWIPPMTEAFPEMVEQSYQLTPKTLSYPIKSEWGYHLVVVNERKSGKELSEAEILKRAKNMMAMLRMEEQIRQWLKQSDIKQN